MAATTSNKVRVEGSTSMASDKPDARVVQRAGTKSTGRGRTKYLVDRGEAREIRSGLLAAALEELFGVATEIDANELAGLPKGRPVELMREVDGPPFVVVGGFRLPVRGLPMPKAPRPKNLLELPEGPVVDVAHANVPRVGAGSPSSAPSFRQGVRTIARAAKHRLRGRR